jgi:hypothetical protein
MLIRGIEGTYIAIYCRPARGTFSNRTSASIAENYTHEPCVTVADADYYNSCYSTVKKKVITTPIFCTLHTW